MTDDEPKTTWHYDEAAKVYIGKYMGGGEPNVNLASFDFDGTLSVPKSGGVFPKNGLDYQLLDDRLPQFINRLDMHRFVIFSNQGGVKNGKTKLADVQSRFEGILKELGSTPCLIMAAGDYNHYRKPNSGMFELFSTKYNGQAVVDRNSSFFVGDAAGRKQDHSDADIKFTERVGLKFFTPEKFFSKMQYTSQ